MESSNSPCIFLYAFDSRIRMSLTPQIDEQEARDIVRLIGNVALREGSRNDRRKLLIDGLAEMIGADSWLWFTSAHTEAGEQPVMTFLMRNGLTDEQFTLLMSASELPDTAKLIAPFFEEINKTGGLTTRLQQQIVCMDEFTASATFELWSRANIGPAILSAKPGNSGQVSMIGFYRTSGSEPFSERESRIAHITLSEIPSLHTDTGAPSLKGEVMALSPRLREVMNCLIQGYGRKAIARHLDLSVHTVGDYVSQLYRRFGVHSQAELIRRFLVGDGGDEPS